MSEFEYGRNNVLASIKSGNALKIYLQEGFNFQPILNEITVQNGFFLCIKEEVRATCW